MSEPNPSTTPRFSEAARERQRQRRADRIAQGVCIYCAKNPPRPLRQACEQCGTQRDATQKAHQAQLIRDKRRLLVARGLCQACKVNPLALPGRMCADCKIENRKRCKQRREELIASKRCPQCSAPVFSDLVNCPRCCERNRVKAHRHAFDGERDTILERDKHRCRLCFRSSDLIVHHIDGEGYGSKTPNNAHSNLITLCRPCHSSLERLLRHVKDRDLLVSLWHRKPLGP